MEDSEAAAGAGVPVRTEGLTREFETAEGPFRALDSLDLAVAAGEFVVAMGPSGSGKTTLLNLLGALDTPTAGEVWIGGVALSVLTERERTSLRRSGVGFVFQQFNLVPHLSAIENVAVPLVIGNRPRDERMDRARDLLGRVDLGARADAMPATLSGGEQQRVAIARALVHEPAVVLADEPTGNLDSSTGLDVVALMAELGRSDGGVGRALVVVTHDERVGALADRVVRLRDGRLDGANG